MDCQAILLTVDISGGAAIILMDDLVQSPGHGKNNLDCYMSIQNVTVT